MILHCEKPKDIQDKIISILSSADNRVLSNKDIEDLQSIEHLKIFTKDRITINQNILHKMTNLKSLIIIGKSKSHYRFDNQSIILNMPSLKEFYLYSSDIKHIDLSKCTNLTNATIYDTDISDITNLNLQQLKTLDISKNKIKDITQLTNCNNLKLLKLNYNPIDCMNFPQLNKLNSLDVSNTKITSIKEILVKCANLKHLTSNVTLIENINDMDTHTNLTELVICDNYITNIENLNIKLPNLKILSIAYNKVTSLHGVPQHIKLLNIQNNLITSLDGLQECKQLNFLNMCKNPITSIEQIVSLPITELNIDEDNNIADLNTMNSSINIIKNM